MWDNTTFLFNRMGTLTDFANITNHTTSLDNVIVFPSPYGKLAISPDRSTAIHWNSFTFLTFYDLGNFSLRGMHDQLMTTTNWLTKYISFNQDSTLALVETDAFHPITILRVANITTVGQYPFSGVIHRATFITDDLILIATWTSLYVLDTTVGTPSLLTTLSFAYLTSEWDTLKDKLYLCGNNTIRVFKVTAVPLPSSSNSSNISSGTNSSALEMSDVEEDVTSLLDSSLSSSGVVVYTVVLVALSTPFTYYFLTFISFFVACSHYALIDMPLPPTLEAYLRHAYIQVNKNAIGWFWEWPFGALTEERVSRSGLGELGLTTDLAMGQTGNLLMAVANLLVFQLLSLLVRKMSKDSFLRLTLYRPKSEIVIGQLIALVMPLTSPWIFVVWGGVTSFPSMLNQIVQYTLLGVILFGLMAYLIYLAPQ